MDLSQTDVRTALQAIQVAAAAQGFAFDLRGLEKIGKNFGTTINAPVTLPRGPIAVDQALRRVLTTGKLRLVAEQGGIDASPLIDGVPMKSADFADPSAQTTSTFTTIPSGPMPRSTSVPPKNVPHYEAFLIDPRETIKITRTDHGDLETVDVILSKSQAAGLLAFSQRNLGKHAILALASLNPNGKSGTIRTHFIDVTAPISDVHLHFDIPNPHRALGVLIAQ